MRFNLLLLPLSMSNLKQSEKMLHFTTKKNARKVTGLDYIGDINHSYKHEKGFNLNMLTYSIYLSPAKSSGYEVCPMRTDECTSLCLNESGRGVYSGTQNARIKKTKLFYEEREFYVRWVISEITQFRQTAKKKEMDFCVRLNNTSDLSPEIMYINDNGVKKNLLQIFPDVQFYDYTKVPNRIKLMEKYPNYDLTFSYSGENLPQCNEMLEKGVRVAMVFKTVPDKFMGVPVIDGDKYDFRFIDPSNVIVGLKFKKVKTKLEFNHKFVIQ